jgi:hypothetical protein
MAEKKPTQQTQPKRGEPVTIPVPTRGQVFGDFAKVIEPDRPKPKRSRRGRDDSGK